MIIKHQVFWILYSADQVKHVFSRSSKTLHCEQPRQKFTYDLSQLLAYIISPLMFLQVKLKCSEQSDTKRRWLIIWLSIPGKNVSHPKEQTRWGKRERERERERERKRKREKEIQKTLGCCVWFSLRENSCFWVHYWEKDSCVISTSETASNLQMSVERILSFKCWPTL